MHNKAKQHQSLRSLDCLAVVSFVHGFAIVAQNSQHQVSRCWRRYTKKEITLASPPLTNREYAYFTVTGKGDSSVVSSILKIEPTNNWSEGENNPRNNQPRKFMRWNLESGLDDTHSIEIHIEKLLSALEPLTLELAELSKKYELYIQCVGYFHPSGHGLHLDRKIIERISRLSVSLDYDFYFVSDNGHDLDYC